MRYAGSQHQALYENEIPSLLREGMSETEFAGVLYDRMMRRGHHGTARFAAFQSESGIGQIAFGESALYPTNFDGPAGSEGNCPALPLGGNPKRFLKRGDLVLVDISFGFAGYNTDKTQIYMFGAQPSADTLAIHRRCIDIQKQIAAQLKPGVRPADIYQSVLGSLEPSFLEHFMGYGSLAVKFLGHGVGLCIDEHPVIAHGFNDPMTANMTLAVEPKKAIPRLGMVGVEDTFVVAADGGQCLTGGGRDIIVTP
jgi:Xaa-Pro aminopeptidase